MNKGGTGLKAGLAPLPVP
jgi:hypothetical protein